MSEVIHTIKLREPVQNGSETVSELKFRKPKAKDFRGVKIHDTSMGDFLDVASKCCAQPIHIMDSLSVPDMMEVNAYMGEFFAAGRETGKKPSA